jgi:hypothetical protein
VNSILPPALPESLRWQKFLRLSRIHGRNNTFAMLLLIFPQGSEWLLTPDGHGGFWAGEEGEPPREQISFDTPVHGKSLRCVLSGLRYSGVHAVSPK